GLHDGGDRRRGHSAVIGPGAVGGGRPPADPLVRLRPLFGGGFPASRHPTDGRLLRGSGSPQRPIPTELAVGGRDYCWGPFRRGFGCQKTIFGLIFRKRTSVLVKTPRPIRKRKGAETAKSV